MNQMAGIFALALAKRGVRVNVDGGRMTLDDTVPVDNLPGFDG